MSVLFRHLFKSFTQGLILAVLLLLAIDVLFNLIKELNDITDSYTLGDVFFFVMLTVPSKIYELFPVSVVVAIVVSVGALASGSELIVMMSAGVSKLKIAWMILAGLMLWLALVVWMGEFVGPAGDQMAQQFRTEKVSKGKVTTAGQAIWLRDGDVIFRTNQMKPLAEGGYELSKVTVFNLEDKRLAKVSEAERAVFSDQQWQLFGVKNSQFGDAGVITEQLAQQQWSSRIRPDILNISTTRPKYLSLREINKYQSFSAQSGELGSAYRVAWWSKLFYPLLVIATALCGIAVLFGQVRSGGFGQRLVIGMVIGIVVYLINKTLLNYGEVYHVHPFYVTVLPALMLIVFLLQRLSAR